jgi:hypothetical protein
MHPFFHIINNINLFPLFIDTASKIEQSMHNWRTIGAVLAAFKGNIYQKHMFANCPIPPLQKYILVNRYKGVRGYLTKNDYLREFEAELKKGPWIRGPGGIVWGKTERRKSRDTVRITVHRLSLAISHDTIPLKYSIDQETLKTECRQNFWPINNIGHMLNSWQLKLWSRPPICGLSNHGQRGGILTQYRAFRFK